MNLNYIFSKMNKLLYKAKLNNEVPVGAIIVKDNKIISKAYNKTNKTNDILSHAEILAIRKASNKLKNWRLDDCTLYISLEPCDMCKEVIKKSRINNIIYFSKQNEYKTEKDPNYKFIKNKEISEFLSNYFKEKR